MWLSLNNSWPLEFFPCHCLFLYPSFIFPNQVKSLGTFSFLIAFEKGIGSKLKAIKDECHNFHGIHCYHISALDTLVRFSVCCGKTGRKRHFCCPPHTNFETCMCVDKHNAPCLDSIKFIVCLCFSYIRHYECTAIYLQSSSVLVSILVVKLGIHLQM